MPDSPHAVSVALPRWEDVIAYEEKDPACINKLQAIYPRFGLNPLVFEIAQNACKKYDSNEFCAWPYPTLSAARKANEHCQKTKVNGKAFITKTLGINCLVTDNTASSAAREFWQHTGLGASSRLAAIALNRDKAPSPSDGKNARLTLRQRLASIYCCEPKNVELHPSGMAALTRALEAITALNPGKPTLQLGFPYVDVLKLPKVVFQGGDLLLRTEPSYLKSELDKRKPAAVIVELPSNPMLQCIDLPTVAKIAHQQGIPVIADDTIGSALNIDALPYADLIFSSLTKSFAGRGDILAGALVISPFSRWKKELEELLSDIALAPLSDPDAIALEETSRDFPKRQLLLNEACLKLRNRLKNHPCVKRVLHPRSCQNFQALMRPAAGYGCLLSFELVEGLPKAKRFYNALEVCKGPSLGTNFTLACPYVLLAHYNELNWAQKCGVNTHLLRVSVGLEDPEKLWERFLKAFKA